MKYFQILTTVSVTLPKKLSFNTGIDLTALSTSCRPLGCMKNRPELWVKTKICIAGASRVANLLCGVRLIQIVQALTFEPYLTRQKAVKLPKSCIATCVSSSCVENVAKGSFQEIHCIVFATMEPQRWSWLCRNRRLHDSQVNTYLAKLSLLVTKFAFLIAFDIRFENINFSL